MVPDYRSIHKGEKDKRPSQTFFDHNIEDIYKPSQ